MKYIMCLIALMLSVSVSAQKLEAHRNLIPNSYNFWFYSPSNDAASGGAVHHSSNGATMRPGPTNRFGPSDVKPAVTYRSDGSLHIVGVESVPPTYSSDGTYQLAGAVAKERDAAKGWYKTPDQAPIPNPNSREARKSAKKAKEAAKLARPLVVFLHGASLCGNNLERVMRYGSLDAMDRGRQIDAYVIAPQNPGGSWNPQKIMSIIEWAESNYNIDSNRIYVLGMSLGGYGTLDMAATYPDRIAAAMALCGGATVRDLSGLNRLPLWIMHGTADKAVAVGCSDAVVSSIKRTGDSSRLIYSRLPGVDHGRLSRCFYLKETYDWLFSHTLQDRGRKCNKNYSITNASMGNAYSDLSRKGHLPR